MNKIWDMLELSLKPRKKRKEKSRENTGKSPSQLSLPSENLWLGSYGRITAGEARIKIRRRRKKNSKNTK